MTRKAYATSDDGKRVLMFPNKALRDWFLAELPPKGDNSFGCDFQAGTCDQYRKALRAETRWERGEGSESDGEYAALDMSVGEYWDCELDEMWSRAHDLGLFQKRPTR